MPSKARSRELSENSLPISEPPLLAHRAARAYQRWRAASGCFLADSPCKHTTAWSETVSRSQPHEQIPARGFTVLVKDHGPPPPPQPPATNPRPAREHSRARSASLSSHAWRIASCWADDIEHPWRLPHRSSPTRIPRTFSRTTRSPDPPAAEGLPDGETKGLGGLEVDDQLELRGLPAGNVAGHRSPASAET